MNKSAAVNFDTMAAVQELQDSGASETQAKAMVSVITKSQSNLATKDDLERLRDQMTIRFGWMLFGMSGLLLAAMGLMFQFFVGQPPV